LLAIAPAWAAESYQIVYEKDVAVKMRDGVILRADVYRPKGDGKFPVLLERTPYDKRVDVGFGIEAASRGYVVILQDVRGRFASLGDWYPMKHEAEDGYDTIEWAAALPESNGKVGMVGGSYLGITQLLAALADPPHLAGIAPAVAPCDMHDGLFYPGGALAQLAAETWVSLVSVDALQRRTFTENWILKDPVHWAKTLPLESYPILEVRGVEGLAPYFADWLKHPENDDYWKAWSVCGQPEKIQVPAFHIGGWYDVFDGETQRNYVLMKERGGNDSARRGQRMVVGPWRHGSYSFKVGEVEFGAHLQFEERETMLRWYDFILKGAANGLEKEAPVKIFVMGKNVWRDESDWPLARAHNTRYYLHWGGKSNSLHGDGTLGTALSAAEPSDQYVYDPADPVPTRGGGLCCSFANPGGAFDQQKTEARDDVLVYSTPPFKDDFEVTGPASLELYASSSAVDTDFTAKLVDVWPNGVAQNLTDGIVRARYRNSTVNPEFLKPGEIYKITIDLRATSNVFLPGHRLRLEVSSSNFPRFNRNLNTGEDPARGTNLLKATNKIYHDRDHPSALILPLVSP